MKTKIYFIALIPSEEIREEVTQFKLYASKHFNSSHALKSPPHITLFPPFRWNPRSESSLKRSLESFTDSQSDFWVSLKGFEHFDRSVIFVKVIPSEELLALQHELKKCLFEQIGLENADKRAFHPHMTVAFKDLKPAFFQEAWSYFNQEVYERSFKADRLFLLQHDGKQWQIIQNFQIGKNINNNL